VCIVGLEKAQQDIPKLLDTFYIYDFFKKSWKRENKKYWIKNSQEGLHMEQNKNVKRKAFSEEEKQACIDWENKANQYIVNKIPLALEYKLRTEFEQLQRKEEANKQCLKKHGVCKECHKKEEELKQLISQRQQWEQSLNEKHSEDYFEVLNKQLKKQEAREEQLYKELYETPTAQEEYDHNDFLFLDHILTNFKGKISHLEEIIEAEEKKSLYEITTKNGDLFDAMIDSIEETEKAICSFYCQIQYKQEIKNIEETGNVNGTPKDKMAVLQ
jgi:hypothetical protein